MTVPTSPGFRPIQDTLPDATYARGLGGSNPIRRRKIRAQPVPENRRHGLQALDSRSTNVSCDAITVTHITTYTTTFVTTSTVTWTGSIVLCPAENTYYQLSDISSLWTTTTVVSASPSTATTSTVTLSKSTTVTPNPIEVYAACATANYADAILASNGSVIPIRYTEITAIHNDPIDSAYECCVEALGFGGSTWLWSSIQRTCYFTYFANDLCGQGPNVTVYYGGDGNDAGANDERVVGNGPCGAATTAKYGPASTLSYPLFPESMTIL